MRCLKIIVPCSTLGINESLLVTFFVTLSVEHETVSNESHVCLNFKSLYQCTYVQSMYVILLKKYSTSNDKESFYLKLAFGRMIDMDSYFNQKQKLLRSLKYCKSNRGPASQRWLDVIFWVSHKPQTSGYLLTRGVLLETAKKSGLIFLIYIIKERCGLGGWVLRCSSQLESVPFV